MKKLRRRAHRVRTVGHFVQIVEDPKVVSQVCGQDDVAHQIQHPLVVLTRDRATSSKSVQHMLGFQKNLDLPMLGSTDLSGKLLKDVAALGVEDGDGLSKVMPLQIRVDSQSVVWRKRHCTYKEGPT